MDETRVVVRKKVEGRVQYNDGEFVEVQTVGIEGIEKDLLLETIQIHCEDTNDTPDEFERRFPVGMWLEMARGRALFNNHPIILGAAAEFSSEQTRHDPICVDNAQISRNPS